MTPTSHSETGTLKSVFIKKATDAFFDDGRVAADWRSLNWLDKPDLKKAVEEFDIFESILVNNGTEIHYLPHDDSVNMDSIYCRDAAIATNQGMILCRMGKAGRANEPAAEKKAFETKGISILGEIISPGTIEGGDVAWLDEYTLAVGHTYRTNPEGIRQLEKLLDPLGISLMIVPLPHYRGPADVFHLMSILSPVDKNLVVVYSPLMPIGFRNHLQDRGYRLVEVPDNEFESMGCNVLALGPRNCLLVKGNPVTKRALEKAGCNVTEYAGSEISVKGGGGPTCLTRPIIRENNG